MLEILVHPARPFLPAQVSPLAGVGRRAHLRLLATDFDMPELCVRDQMPIDKQGRANARAQGNDDDHPLAALSCAKAHLGIASRIRIVEDGHRTSGRFLEQPLRLTPNPFLGHMRGCTYLATPNSSRKTTPDGTVPGEVGCD